MIKLGGPEAKQLVILSGKGGTGKTSVCAAFCHLASLSEQTRAVLIDADVDASNLELVLAPRCAEEHEFFGGQLAVINPVPCVGCGICADVCRFGAVLEWESIYTVDPIACEGCAACQTQCPEDAIRMEPQVAGRWFRSDSRYGPLFHAALTPGAENSGKLVALVKQQASQMGRDKAYPLTIVDGPPGIGCPVIAAVSGADLAVIVAEPTVSGIADMQRILQAVEHFNIPALVCINKADIYAAGREEIEVFCGDKGLAIAGRIPFDLIVPEALSQGEPITIYEPGGRVSQALHETWEHVLAAVNNTRRSDETDR
jgi:MinD superfamily P-loop ATPase